ncbi:MAG: hypothetical protein A2015_06360 [Spirochaetes bacterium GWF1_31_7]|nr:MAG: hypothetical protein A2Y30_08195 [Spirochaetes bacterium GWE1_32_154]OHD51369.1 MAG: hypothetical protein A2Y29_14580 [Spirochaetes bacterium GWE2_31_10]OHD53095.1 MAG: hypothetical protein A2015_06360 [Spirochaetes bacterium GWF1_31_7]
MVADIGSGTGIFTKLLLENGNKVYAIELNDEMRKASEEYLKDYKNCSIKNATAENTKLSDKSINIITVAQSFHWFEIDTTLIEFDRILKNNGLIVLIWNDRKEDDNLFHKEYNLLLKKYCNDYDKIKHKNYPIEKLKSIFINKKIDTVVFENFQEFDFTGLQGRLESASYSPEKGDLNYDTLMGELKSIFEKYSINNTIKIEYNCCLYII